MLVAWLWRLCCRIASPCHAATATPASVPTSCRHPADASPHYSGYRPLLCPRPHTPRSSAQARHSAPELRLLGYYEYRVSLQTAITHKAEAHGGIARKHTVLLVCWAAASKQMTLVLGCVKSHTSWRHAHSTSLHFLAVCPACSLLTRKHRTSPLWQRTQP